MPQEPLNETKLKELSVLWDINWNNIQYFSMKRRLGIKVEIKKLRQIGKKQLNLLELPLLNREIVPFPFFPINL